MSTTGPMGDARADGFVLHLDCINVHTLQCSTGLQIATVGKKGVKDTCVLFVLYLANS